MLNCRCCKKYIVIKLYSRNNCSLGPSICLALSALPYPAHLFNYILTHLLARPPDYKPACLPAYQPTNTPNPSTSTLTQTHLPPNFQPVWSESLLCASYLSTYLTTDPSAILLPATYPYTPTKPTSLSGLLEVLYRICEKNTRQNIVCWSIYLSRIVALIGISQGFWCIVEAL